MYWIYNEEKPVVAERFIRTLKTKICKYMTSDSMELHYSKEVSDPKFKVGDHVRFSKYKYIFAKDINQIGLKKFLYRSVDICF